MSSPEGISAGPTHAHPVRVPELLAPAGDWECAKAAVENGADAIYFGLEKFNARMRANNFTESDLPRLMEFLHLRGVRGYVTFNTLVFPNELAQAEQYLRSIISAGVDAAIVQDVGIARLIRSLSPDFHIHASTQMTITSAAGVEFARKLGCNLVVLARECSIKEIESIQSEGASSDIPLEVFVHGALCVAYSGQCLTSESLGGRSANRGECAQACRMPYELISDGKKIPLGDRRYLLSPQDLAGIEVLPDLIRSGVSSLKIEGRLKSPEYVANITRVYRTALDKLSVAGTPHFTESESYDLQMGFSRGLYSGWFRGINNQQLVHARFGKKRGVLLGQVLRVRDGEVSISNQGAVKPGDGVVFDSGHPDKPEEGGRVYQVVIRGNETYLRFGHGDLKFDRIHQGDRVWKTSDPELDRRVRQTFAGDQPRFQRPLHFEVHGGVSRPLSIIARDDEGHIARSDSQMFLELAQKRPLAPDLLREQLGRLGGTPFRLGNLDVQLAGNVVLPVSELNRMRRMLVADLEGQRKSPKRWALYEDPELPLFSRPPVSSTAEAEMVVLVRNLPQLEKILQCGVTNIYAEFEDPKKYREAVSLVHSANCAAPQRTIFISPPRIFKPGEEWILKQVLSANADGYLVRNYDHLQFFESQRRAGDFSLNVANALSADYFKTKFNLEFVTASYDLNTEQLEGLLRSAPPEWFEITLHQHMPMFHMEHCAFCAFLSEGTDYRNCGRPCDTHQVLLKDRVGAQHPLKADVGCRNTVFNSQAQTGAEFFERLCALGARRFRVEFLNETPDEVERTITQYRKLFRGEIAGSQLWRELKLVNQIGVTRGQMANRS